MDRALILRFLSFQGISYTFFEKINKIEIQNIIFAALNLFD